MQAMGNPPHTPQNPEREEKEKEEGDGRMSREATVGSGLSVGWWWPPIG